MGAGYPILHSRDLVNWTVVGAIFTKAPAWISGSYWAPELAQDRGRFFAYYTARKKGGPLCVAVATAPRPQGPYTDRGPLVCQEVGSIDPFPVNDERGRRYLFWKEDSNSVSKPTIIWAQPLSPYGTRLVGERREVAQRPALGEARDIALRRPRRRPSIVRRGGWFYMFYSGKFLLRVGVHYGLGLRARAPARAVGEAREQPHPRRQRRLALPRPRHGR